MKQEKKQKQVQPKKTEESLSYTVEVRDKEGQVIQRISAPSRSYVEQWNQIVNVQSGPGGTVKDTGGVDQGVGYYAANLSINAGEGSILNGIRVGKGTTPVAIDDYALESPLGEGTGTDEFNHQAVTYTYPAVDGSTCSFTIKRIMLNNSGATISGIREIGAYMRMYTTYYGLAFRDVLPGPVSVPDGGSMTVIYTIAATV